MTNDADTSGAVAEPWLAHFPVTFFATVMGLAGLSLATRAAEHALKVPEILSWLLLTLTIAVFLGICVLFFMKFRRHREEFEAEWAHPVKKAFFPALSISLLLIAAGLTSLPWIARVVWLVGAGAQAGLTLAVISGWIGHRPFQPMHISPAWFIPAVGNVVAPLAGVQLGFIELSWLFFSAGMVFWIVLLTLVLNRLIFHDPLPGKLLPTLTILVAPPAVGFIAWLELNGGQLDALARILFYSAWVFAALVAVQAPKFRAVPFALSWWGLSFPMAALSVATFRYAALLESPAHVVLAALSYTLLVAILSGLIFRTIIGIQRNEICVPE